MCDKTHYMTASFSGAVVDAFREAPVRFTQMRGAYFAVRQCSVVAMNRNVLLHVEAADLLGGVFDAVHSDALKSVLAIENPPEALVRWVYESPRS